MDLSGHVVVTSVLAIPIVQEGRKPYILQTDMTREQAINFAERIAERGYNVFLGGDIEEPENGQGKSGDRDA